MVTMQTIIRFKFEKAFWQPTDEELLDIGGTQYVKIPRAAKGHGFLRLCNALQSSGTDESERVLIPDTLQSSVGYGELVALRNYNQSQDLLESVMKNVPAMFKTAEQTAPSAQVAKIQIKDRGPCPEQYGHGQYIWSLARYTWVTQHLSPFL